MPLTTLDSKSALVVIDLQKAILAMYSGDSTLPTVLEVAQRAGKLADAFRRAGRPVVLVNVAGGAPGRTDVARRMGTPAADWLDLLPELNRQSEDHVVTKRTWGAFTATDLEAHLRGLGITQIVLAGVSTSIGVESTARNAYELGFNVVLATDAMTDLSRDAHANSVSRIFPRLGECSTTEQIAVLLAGTKEATGAGDSVPESGTGEGAAR